MKTKMKHILCTLFMVGILFSRPLSAQTTTESIYLLSDSLEQIGILHNQGLDTVLAVLQKEKKRLLEESGIQITKDSPDEVKKQFLKVGYDAMTKFLKDQNLGEQAIGSMISENDFVSVNSPFLKNDKIISETSTPFQKEYYGKLQEIVRNSNSFSLNQLQEKIKELESRIKAEAPTVFDAAILLSSTVTGRYSAQYWSSRRGEWQALFLPLVSYPNLTDEENKVIYGKAPGRLYAHPSDLTKYIMFTPAGKVSVEQCLNGFVFNERIQSCMPPKLIDSNKKPLGNDELKFYESQIK